jgi:hypothetical protein
MATKRRTMDAAPARHSAHDEIVVDDVKDPGDAFIQAELDSNRRYEWLLIPKALVGFGIVAILIVIRQVFFV